MKKLFGLFLLWFVFLAPIPAKAACAGGACFWILGTGTVDGTLDIGHWAITTGGGSCACVPAATDNITFDANSGGGTATVNMAGALWTVGNFTFTNFTGTLDFATNSNGLTMNGSSGMGGGGAAAKTITMGSATFTISHATANWDTSGSGTTVTAGTSTIAFTATTGAGGRRFLGGGKTYGNVTVAANADNGLFFSGANNNTFASLTFNAPLTILFSSNQTQTVTTINNVTGASITPVLFQGDSIINGRAIVSSANNWSCEWCAFTQMQFQGGGTFSATNSLDFNNNTGITITPPSAGGGIIGSGI